MMAEPKSAAGSPLVGEGGGGEAVPADVDLEVQLTRRPMGQVRLKLRSVIVSLFRAASYTAVPVERFVTPGVLSTDAVCTVPGVVPDDDTACKSKTLHISDPVFTVPKVTLW